MKLKKIIASIAAAAVAVSAMTINAFAATFEGSTKITDTSWWTQFPIVSVDDNAGIENLLGNLDPATVTSITFKSDSSDMIIGYNGTDGTWHQTDKANEVTIQLSDILLTSDEEHDPYIAAVISSGDGVEHTITWTAEGEELAGAADEGDAAPAEDEGNADAAEAEDHNNDADVTDEDEDVDLDEFDDEDFDEDDDVDVDTDDYEDVDDGDFDEDTNDDTAADAGDGNDASAPADNGTSAAPATGNVAVASIAAVMAVAGAAALVSRKRK